MTDENQSSAFEPQGAGPALPDPGADADSGPLRAQYGLIGPFTLREVILGGIWFLAFVLSFVTISSFGYLSLWGIGLDWVLAIGLPTAAVALLVLRRFTPLTRVGSLSADQFASVAFSVGAVTWLGYVWQAIVALGTGAAFGIGGPQISWVPWIELLLMLGGVFFTVVAPFVPPFKDDFDRAEETAHPVARAPRPVIARPAPQPGVGHPQGYDPRAPYGVDPQTGQPHAPFGADPRTGQPYGPPQGYDPRAPYGTDPQTGQPYAPYGVDPQSGQPYGPPQGHDPQQGPSPAGGYSAYGEQPGAAGDPQQGQQTGTAWASPGQSDPYGYPSQVGAAAPGEGFGETEQAEHSAAKPASGHRSAAEGQESGLTGLGEDAPGYARTGASESPQPVAGGAAPGGPADEGPEGDATGPMATRDAEAAAGAPVGAGQDEPESAQDESIAAQPDEPAETTGGEQVPRTRQAFWALVPVERDVLDEHGNPLFRIGPTAWALVIEDRGDVFVVRHDDGRVGFLHDTTGVTRG